MPKPGAETKAQDEADEPALPAVDAPEHEPPRAANTVEPDPPSRCPKSFWELAPPWIQAVIFFFVASFGAWQFWLKEVVWPAAAPLNLTTELGVKAAGFQAPGADNKQEFEAIELVVTARNPSTRNLYLLSNVWVARGIEIDASLKGETWQAVATERIAKYQFAVAGEHYKMREMKLVAGGFVFDDYVLRPNESVTHSFVFYVPQGVYDYVEVAVALPTTPNENVAEVTWTLNPDGTVKYRAYRYSATGGRGEEIKDLAAAFTDSAMQLQTAEASRQLSLWPDTDRASASNH